MNNNILVSVVLPVYNGEQYLEEAILSILNQTFNDFELIIINDGSTDTSLSIIEKYLKIDDRIVVINQQNKGLARSLNIGLNAAKGEYIARMDADDVALPDRFVKQVDFFRSHPKTVLLGTAVELIDKDGAPIVIDVPYIGSSFLKKYLLTIGNPFKHPTVMFRRDLAISVGGYNELIGKYIEDYFLWTKLASYGEIEILNKVLLMYRITPGSIMSSITTKEFLDFSLKIMKKSDFTEEDLILMNTIKAKDSSDKLTEDREITYEKRLTTAKNNKLNKVFNFIRKIFGVNAAMIVFAVLKKNIVARRADL